MSRQKPGDSPDGEAEKDGSVFGSTFRTKLTRTKEQWAREQRQPASRVGQQPGSKAGQAPEQGPETPSGVLDRTGPKGNRVPPGQHLTRNLPILDLGYQPAVDKRDWSLSVTGLVENPLRWDWDAFSALPQTEILCDIHCVTAWSRLDNHWRGVSARDLLSLVQPKAEAAFVLFKSYDGYTTNVPLSSFDDDDVLLATHWEGEPVTREHGGPVRLVLPKLYFWKSPKWIRDIRFADRDHPGFWEVRGYHNFGDPWKEQRYG